MRILHIAPIIAPITESPPGGAELGAVLLAAEQVRQGHSVSMIACERSSLPKGVQFVSANVHPGELIPVDTGLGKEIDPNPELRKQIAAAETAVFTKVLKVLELAKTDFDVVHTHCYDEWALFELHSAKIPFVHTLGFWPICAWINRRFRNAHPPSWARYITCSQYCARQYPIKAGIDVPFISYGLDFSEVEFGETAGSQLVWAGRISPEKGLHTAIDLAEKSGRKIVVMGRVYDEQYFKSEIEHRLQLSHVEYLGFVPHARVLQEFSKGSAFIFPQEWDEPFGYVFIEALAAGCPVLTYARGAASEIIDHGKTGFLVTDAEDLLLSIKHLADLDRRACRASVIERFSVVQMARAYEQEYEIAREQFLRLDCVAEKPKTN